MLLQETVKIKNNIIIYIIIIIKKLNISRGNIPLLQEDLLLLVETFEFFLHFIIIKHLKHLFTMCKHLVIIVIISFLPGKLFVID